MNWLGLVFAVVIIGVIIYLMRKDKKSPQMKYKWIIQEGFGLVRYVEGQISENAAQVFAIRMKNIAERLWPQLCRIYDKRIDMHLESVTLNNQYTHDGKPARVKLYRRAGKMFLRPSDPDAMLLYALELHNLYRGWALGMDWYEKRPGEEDRWDAAIQACKDAVA